MNPDQIPPHVMSGMGRAALEAAKRFFEDPARQQQFEEWMRARGTAAEKAGKRTAV